ncbi:MAG: hypothetical protein AB1646_10875 [Thermodesulfobacteriota bacterium]
MDRLIDRKKTPPAERPVTPTPRSGDDSTLPEALHPAPAGPADAESGSDDSVRRLLERPPAAPENTVEARPPTKHTLAPTKVEKMPAPEPAAPAKPGLKALTLDTLPVPQAAADEQWPALAKRGKPEIVPLPEQEPEFDEGAPQAPETAGQTAPGPIVEGPSQPEKASPVPTEQTGPPGRRASGPDTRVAGRPGQPRPGPVQEPEAAPAPDQPETEPAQEEAPPVERPETQTAEPGPATRPGQRRPAGKPLELRAEDLPPGYKKGQHAARTTPVPAEVDAPPEARPSKPSESVAELHLEKPTEPDLARPRLLPPGYLKKLAARSEAEDVAEPTLTPVEPPEKEDTPEPGESSQPEDRGPEGRIAALPPGSKLPEEPREMEPPIVPEESRPSPAPPSETRVKPPEEPAEPPRPVIPSPLDLDAPAAREVRKYLEASAPILEELSILMARAPGLSIEEYDPSEPTESVGSRDLLIKMETMKRDLQILDAKTFSIIPPAKYVPFHLRIRESVTETFQACDSIIAFLGKRESQYLDKAVDHLNRARSLIRETR